MRIVVSQQPVAILRQPEKMILFFNPRRLSLVDGAVPIFEILFLLEGFTGNAIPPLVLAFVQISRVGNLLNKGRYRTSMPLLGGANEIIKRDIELLPDFSEYTFHLVAKHRRL